MLDAHRLPCWLLVLLAAGTSPAQSTGQQTAVDLTGLSLEELVDVEVTLVARKPERLAAVASAIAVVTGEDIHRAGVRDGGRLGEHVCSRGGELLLSRLNAVDPGPIGAGSGSFGPLAGWTGPTGCSGSVVADQTGSRVHNILEYAVQPAPPDRLARPGGPARRGSSIGYGTMPERGAKMTAIPDPEPQLR